MGKMYTFSIFLSCSLTLSVAQDSNYETEYTNLYMGPYRHIYPPTVDFTQDPGECVANETTTCPLYLALMFSFGEMGSFLSSGVIPSMELAIDQMNSDPTFLPEHNLHMLVQDSQCSRKVALQNFHAHLFQPPTKTAVLGSGCSTATEATAELGPYYNLTQISCLSSSSSLADRSVFTRHFQISASEFILASGFFGVIKAYGWERIGLLTQDENLFTVTINELKRLLKNNSTVQVIERRFDTSDGIITLGENPFDPDVRVFVLSMYPIFAREILCKAYQYRIFYPRALLLVVGWYGLQWWEGSEEDQQDLMNRYGCSVEDRESIVDFITGPRKAGRTFTNGSIRADSGITGYDIEELYTDYLAGSRVNQQPISFYQQCYDATWAMGRALNVTYNQLKNNATLRGIVATYSSINPEPSFGLHHFTYNNVKFHELLFQNLQNLEFRGIVGDIQFDENGLRVVTTVDLTQYRRQDTESGYMFTYTKVGDIIRGTADGDTELIYLPGYSTEVIFPDGIPPDGNPKEVDLGIHAGVSAIFILTATIGIVLSFIGMALHFKLRKKTVIRLSSPNLNLLIGSGAIILYIDIIVTTLPVVGQTPQTITCIMTPWLTAIGYSLCYGTVLAKMTRIYYIFDNPSQRRKKPLKDWKLIMGVIVLVVIDAVILLSYTIVDQNIHAERIPNIENPEDIVGVRETVTRYYVYVCQSQARSIGLSILYGYKMLPQVVALVFAFSIRKIKIKGLDDAKYIAFAVYITSLVTAIVIVITYTLANYINAFSAVFCVGFLIGTTTILFLVLLPPLIGHFQDPEGAKVFPTNTVGSSDDDNKTVQKSWAQDDSTGHASDKQIEGLKKKIVDLEGKIKNSIPDSAPQGFSTSHSGNYFSGSHSKEKGFRKSVDFSEHENITHSVPPTIEEPFKNTPSEANTEELK